MECVKGALLLLPDKASGEFLPEWFTEGESIRVVDPFLVALMFNACGKTYASMLPYSISIEFDGIPVRTLSLEGLLKTKWT